MDQHEFERQYHEQCAKTSVSWRYSVPLHQTGHQDTQLNPYNYTVGTGARYAHTAKLSVYLSIYLVEKMRGSLSYSCVQSNLPTIKVLESLIRHPHRSYLVSHRTFGRSSPRVSGVVLLVFEALATFVRQLRTCVSVEACSSLPLRSRHCTLAKRHSSTNHNTSCTSGVFHDCPEPSAA